LQQISAELETVLTEPEEKEREKNVATTSKLSGNGATGDLWEPFWEPQGVEPDPNPADVIDERPDT
jgi:hypothetical protein